jgi:histone chaperone ASF1
LPVVGVNKFILQAEAPNPATIPPDDLVGVTVLLITCSYRAQEFIRIGYYVNNEHSDPEVNAASYEGHPVPKNINVADITRSILADKPRVTRFPIEVSAMCILYVFPA